jgi:hypothetical protein
MSEWTRRVLACGLALRICVHITVARADANEDARAAMKRGIDAAERGEPEAALVEFDAAKRLAPQANAPYFHAAEALVKLGRFREAVDNLEVYLAKDPSVSDATQTRERIARLRAEHFPGKVRVLVDAAEAEVKIDDEDRGAPNVFELTPGRHRIDVVAPQRSAATSVVTVRGGEEIDARFTLVPIATARRPTVDRVPSPVWRTVGWATAGVGAATLAGSVVVDTVVLDGKLADYEAAADRGDASAAAEARDSASGLRTGVVVGYVAAGVLLLGGTALILFGPSTHGSSRGPSRDQRNALFGRFAF